MRITRSVVLFFSSALLSMPLWAQSTWRCPGNYYTNNDNEAKSLGGCDLVTTPISVLPVPTPSSSSEEYSPRPSIIDEMGEDKKKKEEIAQQKIQAQRKIEQVNQELEALQKEYNGGEPIKIGPEHRNHQKYLDRVERLKRDMQSKEAQIEELEKQLK